MDAESGMAAPRCAMDQEAGAPEGICFVCASLAPGRDGVGDHVRRIADHLRDRGLMTWLLAICDRHADAVSGLDGPATQRVVRIPAQLAPAERYRIAQRAIDTWQPGHISLHMVSWDFGWRGVILDQSFRLARLFRGKRVQVMFHEPWFFRTPGDSRSDPRFRLLLLLGQFQRLSIRLLWRILRPQAAYTSNEMYQRLFADIGIRAGVLPLFGNIPDTARMDWTAFRNLIEASGGLPHGAERENYWFFGIFGQMRTPWDAAPLLRRLTAYAAANGRHAVIVSFGVLGETGRKLLSEWRTRHPDLTIREIGPLDAPDISLCLNEIDFGICHHPTSIAGRSSAVATMLEHGCPVILSFGGELDRNSAFATMWEELLWPADARLEARMRGSRRICRRVDPVGVVADRMLYDRRETRGERSRGRTILKTTRPGGPNPGNGHQVGGA